MEHSEKLVKSLREAADFFEKHGEAMPEPILGVPDLRISVYYLTKDDLAQAAKVLAKGATIGTVKKEQTTFAYEVSRKFGSNLNVEVWADRDKVCTRVQTGVEMKPVTMTIETDEMKEVPIYEWKCDEPLLNNI